MNIENLLGATSHHATIQDSLFEVKKVKLVNPMEGFDVVDTYGLWKHSGGTQLGIVGANYEPTQPSLLFEGLLDTLNEMNMSHHKIEYAELKGGKRIMFRVKIDTTEFRNNANKGDIMDWYADLGTGFDGHTKTSLSLSSNRLICTNGMKALTKEMNVAFRNVKGNVGKVGTMVRELAEVIHQQKDYVEILRRLNNISISKQQHDEFIKRVTGYDLKEYNDLSKQSRDILDNINEAVAIEERDAGMTLWTMLNGITRYTNHMSKSANKMDYIFHDRGLKLNNKAQEVALSMMN